jgi:hypothetical protein
MTVELNADLIGPVEEVGEVGEPCRECRRRGVADRR